MLFRLFGLATLCLCLGCESFSNQFQAVEGEDPGTSPAHPVSLSHLKQNDRMDLGERMATGKEIAGGQSAGLEERAERPVDPFPTVYFTFNSWEINSEIQERLDATAQWMGQFPQYDLTIEGHADIRGTESYNMILSAKRASAVKDYLANLGIPPTRLDTISFGNTMLLCDIDDEKQCHQLNRRADLLLE